MRAFKYIVQGVFITIVLLCVAVFFAPSLPVIGHLEVKIVKSGSMEPTIMTGGVVVVRDTAVYNEGDVITFTSPGSNIPTTHRIIGTEEVNGRSLFVTKGDANEERDTALVAPEAILGKVVASAPYLGFIIDFARQPLGFAFIIGLPALLIVLDEIEKIWREVRKRRRPEKDGDDSTPEAPAPLIVGPYEPLPPTRCMDIKRPTPSQPTTACVIPPPLYVRRPSTGRPRWLIGSSAVVVFALVAASIPWVRSTLSFMSDTEASTDNFFEARALDFALDPATIPVTFIDGVPENLTGFDIVLAPEGETDRPLVYTVSSAYATGTIALCDAIAMDTSLPFVYTGSFGALAGSDIDFDAPWHIDFSLGNGAYQPGDSCVADIVFAAQFADAAGTDGYLDTETVRFTFGALANNPFAPALIEVVSEALLADVATDTPTEAGSTTPADETKNENAGGNGGENNGQNNGNAPEKPEKPALPIPIVTEHSNENGQAVERLTELEEARTDTDTDVPDDDIEDPADDFEPTEAVAEEEPTEDIADPAEDSEPEPTPEPEATPEAEVAA